MTLSAPSATSSSQAATTDLDGTMADTLGDFVVVLHHTLADLGCHPIEIARVDRAFVELTVGKGTEDLLRRTLAHAIEFETHSEHYWRACQLGTSSILSEAEMAEVIIRFTTYGKPQPASAPPPDAAPRDDQA